MTNSLLPRKYKGERIFAVYIRRDVIAGANAVIFPGVDLAEGCAIGAMALVTKKYISLGRGYRTSGETLQRKKKRFAYLGKRILE